MAPSRGIDQVRGERDNGRPICDGLPTELRRQDAQKDCEASFRNEPSGDPSKCGGASQHMAAAHLDVVKKSLKGFDRACV
jgi:hypothetical protein